MITEVFNAKITLYHQVKACDDETKRNITKWVRNVYEECFFGTTTVQSLSGDTLSQASSFIVRIPGIDEINITPGDVVVRGEIFDEIADEQGKRINDVLNRHKPYSFTIRAVCDNRMITEGAHYKLTGV